MSYVQERLASWLDVGRIRLADGTALAVAHYAGAKTQPFLRIRPLRICQIGAPLHLGSATHSSDRRTGLPSGYTVVPANEHEREPLADLLSGTPAEVVVADKGFWGENYRTDSPPKACVSSLQTGPVPVRTSPSSGRLPPPAW